MKTIMQFTLVVSILIISIPAFALSYEITDMGMLAEKPNHTMIFVCGANDAGQVVGFSGANYYTNAFLYTPGSGITNLGTLESGTAAWGINNARQVVGASNGCAFLYTPGTGMTNLGSMLVMEGPMLPNRASAINDVGQVTGVF